MTEQEVVKSANADPCQENLDPLLNSQEFEVPSDMFIGDLPPAITKNRRKLCRIRRADLKARQVYDVMDMAISKLQGIREKLKGKTLRKQKPLASSSTPT